MFFDRLGVRCCPLIAEREGASGGWSGIEAEFICIFHSHDTKVSSCIMQRPPLYQLSSLIVFPCLDGSSAMDPSGDVEYPAWLLRSLMCRILSVWSIVTIDNYGWHEKGEMRKNRLDLAVIEEIVEEI